MMILAIYKCVDIYMLEFIKLFICLTQFLCLYVRPSVRLSVILYSHANVNMFVFVYISIKYLLFLQDFGLLHYLRGLLSFL